MLTKNFLSKVLRFVFVFTISGVLLGSTFVSVTWAMNKEEDENSIHLSCNPQFPDDFFVLIMNSDIEAARRLGSTSRKFHRFFCGPTFHFVMDVNSQERVEEMLNIRRFHDEYVLPSVASFKINIALANVQDLLHKYPNLVLLNLWDSAKDAEEREGFHFLEDLHDSLKNYSTLTCLNLRYIDITEEGFKVIGSLLTINKKLSILKLVDNKIDSEDVKLICNTIKGNTFLRKLKLRHIGIGNTEAAGCLRNNPTLLKLDLSFNDINDEGAEYISQLLNNNYSLTELDLNENKIGDNGAISISNSLKINATLKMLKLKYNNIGDIGKNAIKEALKINKHTIVKY